MIPILEIDDLSKSYDGKKLALSACRFSLEEGQICAVVGESGSGKSTLLRLIAGLERPNSGSIKIKGHVMCDDKRIASPRERHLGFVFQDFTLFPHLTVAENIAFGLKKNQTNSITELLALIKMAGYENAYPSELSGGQEQRVALARTLAIHPDLLLLDEPFSNLDAGLKSGLRQEIRRIVKEVGTSMIFITHDLYDAIDIADEIIFLKEGQMLQKTAMDDFSKALQHEEIKSMILDLKHNAEHIIALIR